MWLRCTGGRRSRRRKSGAIYSSLLGETEAEFGVTDQSWMEWPIDHETAGVMNDGLWILYDPAGRLERAVAYAASSSQ